MHSKFLASLRRTAVVAPPEGNCPQLLRSFDKLFITRQGEEVNIKWFLGIHYNVDIARFERTTDRFWLL